MLSYSFVRSGALTPNEFMFLSIVDSFSGESHLKLKDFAEIMHKSIRSCKRILKSLKEKNYIVCRYGLYKSIHLSVNALSNAIWRPNVKKIFQKSKGPNWFVKRAMPDLSNIERNKENNKKTIRNYFKSEEKEHPGGKDIPVSSEMRSILDKLLKK